MKLSDVYMMPHKNEGLGTPILESLACGIPVIANSNEACFQQWIEHGENGYLCKLNIKYWLNAIKEISLLNQKDLLNNNKSLINESSTKKIDNDYWEMLNSFN